MAFNKCISKLKHLNEPKSEQAFYVKLLVHFIGDLHQPMHEGRKEDRGRSDVLIRWMKKPTNLHRL